NSRLLLPLTLLCASCGAPADDGERALDDLSIGTERQAIKNGFVLSSETYSGIVALQTWYSPANTYLTICTGALMTNNKVITAQHCNSLHPGETQYAKMGSQRFQVIDRGCGSIWA